MEATKAEQKFLQNSLLLWYRKGHRQLPWRASNDPYQIWISEVMLQQTQSETVKGYFSRFLERFPTVTHLAESNIDDVLTLWSGLGYYSRARNLHKAAQEISNSYGGIFPQDEAYLLKLPGIGRYTAGAIRSIAFCQKAPVVDGNVIRVLSRFFAIKTSPWNHAGQKVYWQLSSSLIPSASHKKNDLSGQNNPGDFNQSLMELGATVCTPQKPNCTQCPIQSKCKSFLEGTQLHFPPPKKESAPKEVFLATLLLFQKDKLLLAKRPEFGLFGGLFEPPTFELSDPLNDPREDLLVKLTKEFGPHFSQLSIHSLEALPIQKHVLTHRLLHIRPFVAYCKNDIATPLKTSFYVQTTWSNPSHLSLGISSWAAKLLDLLR